MNAVFRLKFHFSQILKRTFSKIYENNKREFIWTGKEMIYKIILIYNGVIIIIITIIIIINNEFFTGIHSQLKKFNNIIT
jgi:hypothetical protein